MAHEFEIELGLDYGTWKFEVAYSLFQNGERTGDPGQLIMTAKGKPVRMMATWVEGRLVHGEELLGMTLKSAEVGDKVIDLFKLPLYSSDETTKTTDRVQGILKEMGKTLDDLLADHIQAVVADVRKVLADSDLRVTISRKKIQAAPVKVRLTVPQMWSQNARRRMQMAAKRAGIETVVLASEPKCALSFLMEKVRQRKVTGMRTLRKGSVILVADCGGGTVDLVTYELEEDLSDRSKLKAVGHSSGDIYGSFMVDQRVLENFLESEGDAWMDQGAAKLQMTKRDFERRMLMEIEKLKCAAETNTVVHTGGVAGPNGKVVPLAIPDEQMDEAIKHVVAGIVKSIGRQVTVRRPNVIEVTGGFAKSAYLMKKLKDLYEPKGIAVVRPNVSNTDEPAAVAVGALLRYADINHQLLPSQYGYAILRREVFDPALHRDSYKGRLDNDDSYKPWVMASPYDATVWVVDDRILNIIPAGDAAADGTTRRTQEGELFFVPEDEPILSAEFVYLTKNFKDHESGVMHETDGQRGAFRDGVHEWAEVKIPLNKARLQHEGCGRVTTPDGEVFWKLDARPVITREGDNMKIGFEILLNPGEGTSIKPAVYTVEDTVWESAHSEFLEESSDVEMTDV